MYFYHSVTLLYQKGIDLSITLCYYHSMSIDPDKLTTAQVLRELNTSRPILQRLMDDHKIAPINPVPPGDFAIRPRRFLFARADVERLKAERAALAAQP